MSSVSLDDQAAAPSIIEVMVKPKKRTKPLALGAEFPQRLIALRKRAELSQEALGKALGYDSGQTVSNWERGENEPSPGAWPLLVKVLGCTAEELLGEAARAFGAPVNQILTPDSQPQIVGSHRAGRENEMIALAILKLQERLDRVEQEIEDLRSGERRTATTTDPRKGRRTS